MRWSAQTIKDFGRIMGFSNLSLPESGALVLAIEGRATIYLQGSTDKLLVYTLVDAASCSTDALAEARALCDEVPPEHAFLLQAELWQSNIILLASIFQEDVIVSELDRAVTCLLEIREILFSDVQIEFRPNA